MSLLVLILFPTILIKGWNTFIDNSGNQIIVKVMTNEGKTTKMPLEEYLKGVVAAEMPASFEMEALKAQTVAARTYVLRKLQGSQNRIVEITTDVNLDQAWLTKSDMLDRWGHFKYWFKIAKAVESTQGVFLSYQGEVILAAYHSASGQKTAAAQNVWGSSLPYLQSVSSPYEANSPYSHYVQKYSLREFAKKLGMNFSQIRARPADRIHILARSKSGRVLKIKIADRVLTGRELRRKLGLKSTNFQYQIEDGEIKFITSGNGHGVGMSQYGANGMAQKGYDYLEILKHYYPGAEIKRINYQ